MKFSFCLIFFLSVCGFPALSVSLFLSVCLCPSPNLSLRSCLCLYIYLLYVFAVLSPPPPPLHQNLFKEFSGVASSIRLLLLLLFFDLIRVLVSTYTERRRFYHMTGAGRGGGNAAQLVEHRTGTPPTQAGFFGAARDFSPRANFQCRLSYGVRTHPCAITCIDIGVHVKDPVVHVRVRWIMETLNHPACTLGCIARLCRSWLSLSKTTRIPHGRNPIGTIQL